MTMDEVQKKSKAIWNVYSQLEELEEKYDSILDALKSMILSSFVGLKDNAFGVTQGIDFLIPSSDLDMHTHMLSIYQGNCSINRESMLYGDIPAMVIAFSKISIDHDDLSRRDLSFDRNSTPIFRGRRMEEGNKVWFAGDEPENWEVLCDGRLICCKDSIDSVNNAGWYFVLPLAAIDSIEDAKEMILKPLQVLLQGVNPEEVCMPRDCKSNCVNISNS